MDGDPDALHRDAGRVRASELTSATEQDYSHSEEYLYEGNLVLVNASLHCKDQVVVIVICASGARGRPPLVAELRANCL